MWDRVLLVSILAASVQACVAHSARGTSGDDGEPESEPPADVAPAEPRPAGAEGCAFAEGIGPERLGPAMPRVSAPDGVTVRSAEAAVELAADGGVRVRFALDLANAGAARAEARVGYAFRLQGSEAEVKPSDGVAFDGELEVTRCAAASPPKMHAVFRDETIYATVPIEPGEEARVEGEASFGLSRASSASVVLGQEDSAAQNLKNFKWAYVKDDAYAAIADRAKPFYGAIALVAADALKVTITAQGKPWLRGVSYEQNAVPVQAIGAVQLRFGKGEAPSAVAFEYNPELDLGEELAFFRKLAAARPDDLRAQIRVADLLRFGGDPAERAAALEKLLAAWDANAKAQLLTGRNDVRAAAYVALVRSLEASGRSADARKRAAEGKKVAESLDATSDLNRLASRWLKGYLGEKVD